MPIAARVIAVALGAAGWARIDVATQGLGTTLFDGLERGLLAGQQLLTVLRPIGWAVLTHNLAQRGHGNPAVSCSSAAAAVCSACWVR